MIIREAHQFLQRFIAVDRCCDKPYAARSQAEGFGGVALDGRASALERQLSPLRSAIGLYVPFFFTGEGSTMLL